MKTITFIVIFISILYIFIKLAFIIINIYKLIFKLPEKLRNKVFYDNDNVFTLKYHFKHWKNLFDKEDSKSDIEIKKEIKELSIKGEKLFFIIIVEIILLILVAGL